MSELILATTVASAETVEDNGDELEETHSHRYTHSHGPHAGRTSDPDLDDPNVNHD